MQKANEANIALDELAITPAQVAAVVALVEGARCPPSWPPGGGGCAGRRR